MSIIPMTCNKPNGRLNQITLLNTAVSGSTVPNNVVSFASRYSKLLINIQKASVVPKIIVKAKTIIVLAFTIIFGTTLAFWMFIKSLEYLEAKETTLLGTVEPLTAVLSSVIWLSLPFGLLQVMGMILILVVVV